MPFYIMTMKEIEIEKLVSDIDALKKPLVSSTQKMAMWSKISSKIGIEEELVADVRQVSEGAFLTKNQKVEIKENILSRIEIGLRSRFSISGFLSFHKKLLSSTLALLIVFSTFAVVRGQDSVVMASSFVHSLDGGVTIHRDGEAIKVAVGTELKEGDVIVTGEDGTMEIYFFNDSKSRLAANTEIVLDKLSEAEGRSANDYVEVDLVDGRLWSNVLDLSEDESFFVIDVEDTSISSKNAVFDVALDDGELEIGVFNENVEVSTGEEVQQLVSGKKLFLAEGATVVKEIEEEDRQIAWVQDNMKSDEVYLTEVEKRLLTAKFEAEGIDVDEGFDFEESLQDKDVSFLSFDDVDKQKKKLDEAIEVFVLASADLELDDESLINFDQVVEDFEKVLNEIYAFADEISFTDSVYGDELRTYVDDTLALHEYALSEEIIEFEPKEVIEIESKEIYLDDVDDIVEAESEEVFLIDVEVEEVIEADELVIFEEDVQDEQVVDGPFGVKIQGDKVLPPLF